MLRFRGLGVWGLVVYVVFSGVRCWVFGYRFSGVRVQEFWGWFFLLRPCPLSSALWCLANAYIVPRP